MKSLETGATRSIKTVPDGTYRIVALPLGAQEVRASKKTASRPPSALA